MREFVYLDEGSLRSLLSSQTGEIKDAVSQQSQASVVDEMNLKLSGGLPFAATGEAASKFQTSNSSTFQTSSKATVQSWFKDLHDRSALRLISPVDDVERVDHLGDLAGLGRPSVASPSTDLKRGVLAEFRVRLAAHPAFHLTTMMTEFTGMAADFEEIVPDASVMQFNEIQPMLKVLQRLMAGLIPILGEAIDHVVIEVDGVEFVVHREAIAGIEIASRPLFIAGVTDAQSYWKDIRRVLFADAEFTMLCRVSRAGIQTDWMPVKLVDIFRKIAPDFSQQISVAWSFAFGEATKPARLDLKAPATSPLETALAHYGETLLATSRDISADEDRQRIGVEMDREIHRLKDRAGSVSDQKSAFTALKLRLKEIASVRITAEKDMKLRDEARALAGLSLMPALTVREETASPAPAAPPPAGEPRAYLDAEVVAVYW